MTWFGIVVLVVFGLLLHRFLNARRAGRIATGIALCLVLLVAGKAGLFNIWNSRVPGVASFHSTHFESSPRAASFTQETIEPRQSLEAPVASASGVGTPLSYTEREFMANQVVSTHQATESTLPDWVKAQAPLEGSFVSWYLESERFATVEEARAQLRQQLKDRLLASHGTDVESSPWVDTALNDLIASGLVRKECEIVWPLEIGSFTEPMYQLCWQTQVTPMAAQRLTALTRRNVVQQRLTTVGIGLAALTSLMALGAVGFRRRQPA